MTATLRAVREMTERLFPGSPVDLEELVDPAVPGNPFCVFSVSCALPAERIVDEQCRWHAELLHIAPDALNAIRLSIRDVE